MDERFERLVRLYNQLKNDHLKGKITRVQFQNRLTCESLPDQDHAGCFWSIAIDTGKWIYFDGHHWIETSENRSIRKPRNQLPGSLKLFLAILGIASFISVTLFVWMYFNGSPGKPTPKEAHIPIIIGEISEIGQTKAPVSGILSTSEQTVITSGFIAPEGGQLIVEDPGSPHNGFNILILENAFDDRIAFTVYASSVNTSNLREGVSVASPMYSIENQGIRASQPMVITIPVETNEERFAMAFFYDEHTESFEGLPLISSDKNKVCALTRHFSNIVVLDIEKYLLTGEVDTGFRPGKDDWNMKNDGSWVAYGGYCSGMVLTSIWYYLKKTRSGAPDLFKSFNEGDEDIWQDNVHAVRLVSSVQEDNDFKDWKTRLKPYLEKISDKQSFDALVFSMLLTGEPQFVGVYNRKDLGLSPGHALAAYRIVEGNVYIYDPNYQKKSWPRIFFENEEFKPYISRRKMKEEESPYDLIRYLAKSAVVDWNKIGKRWAEFNDNSIGKDRFPEYSVVYGLKEGKKYGKNRWINEGETIKTHADEIAFRCEWTTKSNLTLKSKIYIRNFRLNGEWIEPKKAGGYYKIPLKDGENKIGLSVYANRRAEDAWLGFNWITVQKGDKTERDTPIIQSIFPDKGPFGTTVTIYGSGFGENQNFSELKCNTKSAQILNWSDTQIVTKVPLGMVSGMVYVTVRRKKSNAKRFMVDNTIPFEVSRVHPDHGLLLYEHGYPTDFLVHIEGRGIIEDDDQRSISIAGQETWFKRISALEVIDKKYAVNDYIIHVSLLEQSRSGNLIVDIGGKKSTPWEYTVMNPSNALNASNHIYFELKASLVDKAKDTPIALAPYMRKFSSTNFQWNGDCFTAEDLAVSGKGILKRTLRGCIDSNGTNLSSFTYTLEDKVHNTDGTPRALTAFSFSLGQVALITRSWSPDGKREEVDRCYPTEFSHSYGGSGDEIKNAKLSVSYKYEHFSDNPAFRKVVQSSTVDWKNSTEENPIEFDLFLTHQKQ